MFDAVVAGHLCIDIIPTIPPSLASTAYASLLSPGRLVEVGVAVLSPGGAVSNTGLSLARLGMKVRLVARLGDDLIGGLTRRIIEDHGHGLGAGLAIAGGEPSSYTIVISPPGIDRTFLHCPGTNDTFGPEDVADDLLRGTRLFHLGYPPLMRRMYAANGAELAALLERAQAGGATTSLDLALPDPATESGSADWRAILGRALPHVDLFMPSVEELFFMLDRSGYEEARRRSPDGNLLEGLTEGEVARLAEGSLTMGAKAVGLKLGDRGLYLRTAESGGLRGRAAPADSERWLGRELWAPCFRVEVASTVGAGDATIAGFLAGLLSGQRPEECLTTAVAVGACNVEAADATGGVRSWDETQRRIADGWERLAADPMSPRWTWNRVAGLWYGPHDRFGGL